MPYRALRAEDAAEQERRSLQILHRTGSALSIETDLGRPVEIVTDAGVELTTEPARGEGIVGSDKARSALRVEGRGKHRRLFAVFDGLETLVVRVHQTDQRERYRFISPSNRRGRR